MKIKNLLFIVFLYFGNTLYAQLLSDSLMISYTQQQVDSIYTSAGIPSFVGQTNYDVNVYKILYETTGATGAVTTASGALFLPENVSCGLPIISYQHGTLANESGLPSKLGGEALIGTIAASHGYAVVMPDYIGMGDSPGFHPYCHAQTEANAVLDIIRSGKLFCNSNGYALNDQIFLMGYSQGGHATMAAIKEIELNYSSEFNVVASVPMAGPYDISGVQRELLENDSVYSQPGYLPYIIMGYNEVYDLYDSLQEVFAPPYDSILATLFDGTNGMGTINGYLPSIPKNMIDSAYFANFLADSLHPFKEALRDNDLYNWVPQTHIRMAHCAGDNVVPYEHAQIAYDAFIAAGADSVELINNGNMDHGPCGELSIIGAKLFIDTKAELCGGGFGGAADKVLSDNKLLVYPNPSIGSFVASISNTNILELNLVDLLGKKVFETGNTNQKEVSIELTVRPGIYLLRAKSVDGVIHSKKISVK
ncbi:MAG: T9SS type A sorting domain-containing protein [Flavobacteriales bacterium]|nr:T9SS type A sorting domain-containing protein [Flavobacteriales bacterium]